MKKSSVEPPFLAPYEIDLCRNNSSTFWKGRTFFSTVRKATRVPTYEATMTMVKNHQILVIIRGATALKVFNVIKTF